MIRKKIGLFVIIMLLLIGCSNLNHSKPAVAVAEEEQDVLIRQSAEATMKENKVVRNEASIAVSENESLEIESQETKNLTAAFPKVDLTEEELQNIKILTSATIHASQGSMEEYLVDHKMLESNDLESELWVQTQFILSVYNYAYANEASKRLANATEMIDEEVMLLTQKQLYALLEMAGVKPSEELKSYDYLNTWFEDGYYRIPIFYGHGEIVWAIDFEKIERMEDGKVLVNAVLRLEDDYGAVKTLKIILLPNPESIFQYSVESIRVELIHPDEVGIIGMDPLLQKPYEIPNDMSNNPFDYIFELEGSLYQMPFPAAELKRNGWILEEDGNLEAGERKTVHVSKGDALLTVGLWNYNTTSSGFAACQVVWLKTGRDKDWSEVSFKLSEGVENGQQKIELQPLYCDYLNEYYTLYSRRDALYRNSYGYDLYFENDVVKGFEMGYAPTPIDRQERIRLMTEGWGDEAKSVPEPNRDFEIEENHIYQIDIDGDGIREEICIKELTGIKWAGYLCVFIDGELNHMVRGLASHQIYCHSIKMVIENGQYFLIFEGEDYANEIFRKIRVEKGWSKEVPFGLPES